MRTIILTIMLSALLTHCGKSIQSAGGSSTAGNGIVAGTVRSTEGQAVANASVYLYGTTGELAADTATDSTRSDINGSYAFNDVVPGTYTVLAKINSTVNLTAVSDVNVLKDEEVEVESMILTKSTKVSGTPGFDIEDSWTVFAAIRGTPLRDTLEDDLTFMITDVPSGRYSLVLFAYTSVSGDVNCIAVDSLDIIDGTLKNPLQLNRLAVTGVDEDTLILDTFDDGNELLLNNRTTWWQYTGGDSDPYDATTVTTDFAETTGWNGIGSCAHVTASYDPENSNAYVGFGCMIDNEVLSYHNLFTMEQLSEIRLRIRGTPVECSVVLYSPAYNTYNIVHVLDTVPDEWTEVVINISAAIDGMDEVDRERWYTTRYWIEQITFNFYKHEQEVDQAQFFIDDILFVFEQ